MTDILFVKDPRDGTGRPGGFLYTWDGGNQLTYPVKYHDIGYKVFSTNNMKCFRIRLSVWLERVLIEREIKLH